jgi:hypothetical protein
MNIILIFSEKVLKKLKSFWKPHISNQKPPFLRKCIQKASLCLKMPQFKKKPSNSLKMYLKSLKMSLLIIKASVYLKIILKSLGFFGKTSHHSKKSSFLGNMSSKSLVILKKASYF